MTYPLSSDVSAGQPTAAAHYNNLRADALRFGQDAADGANIGDMFSRYGWNINLVPLSTDRLRMEGTSTNPIALVVDGVPLKSTSNVDLPVSGKPSGGAATWYVFAAATAGSSVPTIEVNTVATESAGKRLIGSFYWNGSAIEPGSIRVERYDYYKNLLSFEIAQVCMGRLTLASGDPVPSADQSAKGTLYFTPCNGDRIALYTPGWDGWTLHTFSELSISLASLGSGVCADVFVYNNAGTLTLELVQWSNTTTRATAIVFQDGVYCKSGSLERRYLGTLYTSGVGAVSDTVLFRYVFNYYNRVHRPFQLVESTNSWTVTAGSFGSWNGTLANQFAFVVGVDDTPVTVQSMLHGNAGSSGNIGNGFCLDNNNAFQGQMFSSSNNTGIRTPLPAGWSGFPGIGYHYLALVQYAGTANATCYGDNAVAYIQSGANGWIMA